MNISPVVFVIVLFSQTVPTPDFLANGRSTSDLADRAVSIDYQVGPEDKLDISMPFADEFRKAFEVDSSGDIDLPFAGRMHVTGLTTREIQKDLDARLATYFVSPHALVIIASYGSKSVSILGAVRNPARHQLEGRRTLLDLLSASGGLAPEAGSRLILTRTLASGPLPLPGAHLDSTGHFQVAEIDVTSLMSGDPVNNIMLCAEDSIYIPKAKLIYVMGDVHRQGGFPFSESNSGTALQALALAEGLGPSASPSHAMLLRKVSPKGTIQIPLNLSRILEHKDEDVPLQPEDLLYVPDSRSKKAVVRGMEAAIQMGTGVVIWHTW